MNYKNNKLGLNKIGLGCGGMTSFNNEYENIATIHEALDNGINIINTADFYGSGISEMIIGKAIKGKKRENIFISGKTGALVDPSGQMYGLDVDPFHIKNQLAQTLKRLNLDYIDLYQPARIDLDIPVEETIGAISDLVKEGYVKHIGITQVDANTLKRAHRVHPISFIEVDYSLFNRSAEDEIIPTARELGIEIVAFGSLAHGLLSGSYTKEHAKKYASRVPMFSDKNIDINLKLVENLRVIADEKCITIPQLSLAWVLSKGNDILSLVGASRRSTLLDSIKANDIVLNEEDINRIEKAIPREDVAGSSFPTPIFRNGRVQW